MTPEELFYLFPEPVPDVCWRLRDLVREEATGATEEVRLGWRVMSFTLGHAFCSIAPQQDHARLLFDRGQEFDDPDHKLEGTGSQARYLRFDDEAAIDEAIVRGFVRQALAHPP